MKSKPPNRKMKVEVSVPPGTPENPRSAITPISSPAGSTSSTASSLTSAGTSSYTLSIRPAPEIGSSVVVPGPSGSGTTKAAKSKGAAGVSGGSAATEKGNTSAGLGISAHPAHPILIHYNLDDFPKINACISGSKGGPFPTTSNTVVVGEALASKTVDNLTMEDVDMLQSELETLWSSVATRIRILHREQSALQSTPTTSTHHSLALEHFDPQHQEKIAAVATIIDHGTRTSVSAAAKLVMASQLPASNSPVPSPSTQTVTMPSALAKRSTGTKGERLPKKKLKGEAGGKSKKGDKPAARATQNRSHSVSSDLGADGPTKQHEAPSQFWEWTDKNYFKDVTTDDLDCLSQLIEEQEKLSIGVMETPPLGKHFKEDEETAKKKARESRTNSSRDQVGPLTQRLVSALVDERVSAHNSQCNLVSPKEDASLGAPHQEGLFIQRQGLVRALGLDGGSGGTNSSLENRIRDCLLDHGLLLPEDANDPMMANDPDDEILAEIKRTQSVFNKLQEYNAEKLNELLSNGQKAMKTYALQRDLDKADKDVIEAYKVIAACRLKKKPVTKKEKDTATKALEARRKALEKLEGGTSASSSSAAASASATSAPIDAAGGLLRMQL